MIFQTIFLLLLFLILQGFFSGMETGLVSIRRPRVENAAAQGDRKAKVLLFFLNHSGLMISTVLIGVNISTVCASLAAKSLVQKMGFSSPLAFTCVTALLSLLMLFCETVPKSYFRQDGYHRCGRFIFFFRFFYWVLYVPANLFNWFTSFLERIIRPADTHTEDSQIRENLKLFLRESESGGVLFSETTAMLDRAVDFHGTTLEHVMIPAEKLCTVVSTATVFEAVELCRKGGFASLPVVNSANPEKIPGVFQFADAVFACPENRWKMTPVSRCMRPCLDAPVTDNVVRTMTRLKTSPASTVIVRDSENRFCGMVTMNRLAEALFGEMR